MSRKLLIIVLVVLSGALGALYLGFNYFSNKAEIDYRLQTRFQNNGMGMLPTISDGAIVIVDEEAYEQTTPARGDLILFQFPFDTERLFIKRVIGLPDEQLEVIDGTVYIDGEPLNEPYIQEPADYSGSWQIENNGYFVLGDNRNNSADSHNWRTLEEEFIQGKIIAICASDSPETCVEVTDVTYGVD